MFRAHSFSFLSARSGNCLGDIRLNFCIEYPKPTSKWCHCLCIIKHALIKTKIDLAKSDDSNRVCESTIETS